MGFFKEVDLAIQEQAPDEKTAKAWLHLANEHFQGRLLLKELPIELQVLIRGIEEIFQRAVVNIAEESEV